MRVFVASWFFPPQTSSEGIVTYKLLRNSKHEYDVISANCALWGYNEQIKIAAENIHNIAIDTESLEKWKEETIRIFEEKNKENPYEVVMTRCMPNESLEIGIAIKKTHPSIKWICSLADPVANNPYWISGIENYQALSESTKKSVINDLALPRSEWSQDWLNDINSVIREQFYWKDIQDQSIDLADMVVTPSIQQRNYMASEKYWKKFLIVPHSYDDMLYQNEKNVSWDISKSHFLYTGYSDSLRSLRPFVDAVKWIQDNCPDILEKIQIHFYGNYPSDIIDRALAYGLSDVFDFGGNISYVQSLSMMQAADWLLHVDAFFPQLKSTGGSIFFAGKLADYIGSCKPILALTGNNSPASIIVQQYGGISCFPWETERIAQILVSIVTGKLQGNVNLDIRQRYNAENIAISFDLAVDALVKKNIPANSVEIIGKQLNQKKLLTICVPSYNSQSTLTRTLNSLLHVSSVKELEVLIIDDGSSDNTSKIAAEYVEKYPDSVILVRKPNGGHGSGIRKGIELASGYFFRVVDSDDWVNTRALESEIQYIKKTEDLPDIIYTPYYLVDQQTGDVSPWPIPSGVKYNYIYKFDDVVSELGVENVYFTMAATSFRTEILKNMNLVLREKCYYTDSEFILKPITHVEKVVFLDSAVYRYLRSQAEQSVAPLSFVKHYLDHERVLRELIVFEQKKQMSESQRKYMKHILNQHLVTNYQILLEFDPDISHGLGCMKEFDNWLKDEGSEYYKWTSKNLKLVRAVRMCRYDIKRTIALKKHREKIRSKKNKDRKKNIINRMLHSKVFINRFTRRFLYSQRNSNGILYKLYKRLK